jgi:DNA-binding PadR family transcriptional regulator
MEATGLPSGTVYPAMRRLERQGFIKAHWDSESSAAPRSGPPRRNYEITSQGEKALAAALERFHCIDLRMRLGPKPSES